MSDTVTTTPRAFYWGCMDVIGHGLHDERGMSVYPGRGFRIPWSEGLMDGGLLQNGKMADDITGLVKMVPAKGPWTAFVWWDRTGDKRHASNSGFYVYGFEWDRRKEAFEFACAKFPKIVARQAVPLVLVEK